MRTGLYLALVQLLFTVTWTIYVAFLPQLAAAAGIPKERVLWILMLDQAIFILMDFAIGIAADRVSAAMRRISTLLIVITAISAAAFVLLPHAGASAGLLLALTAIWAITSSALRAPPMVMFSKYVNAAAAPRLVFLSLLGIGLAGAIAPWLTARLRGVSPTLPFVLAALGLISAVLAMGWCERRLKSQAAAPGGQAAAPGGAPATAAAAAPTATTATTATASAAARRGAPSTGAPPAKSAAAALFMAVLLLSLGFQVHAFLNSAPAYLVFAKAPDLEWLMGLFWVGFSICVIAPGAGALQNARPAPMLMGGTAAGALALAAVAHAPNLPALIAAQLAAGAAWGLIIGYAFTAALDAGRTGREGRFTGLVFALLALAALTRFGFVVSGLNQSPGIGPLLGALPAVAWAGALLLLVLAARGGAFSR